MEGSFNSKNIKPSLTTPTKMGKQLDSNFKSQIRKSGMKLSENGMLHEKEESLKKKIFKLDKMETLVHTDENLSKVFNEMKQDAAEKFGYHWNETILNIIFNDYVLNSPKNLQKYKNTRAKPKKRRGEEGIKELQNDIDKEKAASSGAEERKEKLMGGDDKEKVDEFFNFGKSAATELPMNQRSKNDTYFVDMRNKKLLAPVPYNASQEAKQAIISKYVGQPNIKQLAWYDAVKQGIKGVPTEVPDGSIQQIDQELQQRYGNDLQTIPALGENLGQPVTSAFTLAKIIAGLLPDQYTQKDFNTALENYFVDHGMDFAKLNNQEYVQDISHFLASDFGKTQMDETTGAAGAGAFAPALDNQKPVTEEKTANYVGEDEWSRKVYRSEDGTMYVDVDGVLHSVTPEGEPIAPVSGVQIVDSIKETTTSASSGQYSGPAIWAKNPNKSRWAHRPAWHGGKILESVVDKRNDYLTEAGAFKKYLINNMLFEAVNMGMMEAESFQDHAKRIKAVLDKYLADTPEIANADGFKDAYEFSKYEAETGKAHPNRGKGNVDQEVNEHHLHSKQEKIDFILQYTYDDASDSATHSTEELNAMSDGEIENLYRSTEKKIGLDEFFSFGKKDQPVANNQELSIGQLSGYKNNIINVLRNLKFGEQMIDALNKTYDQIVIKGLKNGVPADVLAQKIAAHYSGQQVSLPEQDDTNFRETMVKDLKYNGKPASDSESTEELESQDGLFKGKWNSNTSVAENDEEMDVVEERPRPQDDDCFVSSNGFKLSASCGDKYIGEFTEDEAAWEAVRNWKKENNYYPNTWFISDHGNESLVDDDGNEIKEGFGGDPEVGEDQYKEEQDYNRFAALEQQSKELAQLRDAGDEGALKAKIDSLQVIPMINHSGGYEDGLGHRDLEKLGYTRITHDYSFDEDGEFVINNISNKPIVMIDERGIRGIINPGESDIDENTSIRLHEKASSKSQQRFMGMVHAAQKGELKNPSPAVAKAAKSMSDKDAEDFASTKHKGLPNHVKKKKKKVDEGLFTPSQELNIDQIRSVIDNFKQSPESSDLRDKFVKAKDYVKSKAGHVARMPQLKMWLDQNMPQLSNYVGMLWGNWDLMPSNSGMLQENKGTMKIDEKAYKDFFKSELKKTGKSLGSMSAGEKKVLFEQVDKGFKKLNESIIDDQPDSMVNNQESSMAKSMDSDELNKDGMPAASSSAPSSSEPQPNGVSGVSEITEVSEEEPQYFHSGADDPQVALDAAKFREMLKTKYGVESVSQLSPAQRHELMKSMNFGGEKPADQIAQAQHKTDDDRAAYAKLNDPTEALAFLNQRVDSMETPEDYKRVASEFKQATGKSMLHPMAIYGVIQNMSPEERQNYNKLEQYFRLNMSDKQTVNEERKVPAILNVEKLGAENAKNFAKDNAEEDALKQDKTYPKDDGIHKAPVWPDPKTFYIEQGKGTSQELAKEQTKEAKSMADIEAEVLAKTKGALENIGNSTADGKHIPKRNLTKEEGYELAMNRGDGMQDIVYDLKPSEKFEDRMKKDMGDHVYKSRQDKMDYKAEAPMYNKDTQPVEDGDDKNQYNKFAKGYNLHEVSARYKDDLGKGHLVEFKLGEVEEVTTIADNYVKLSIDGMGNKYSIAGKKMNENKGFNEMMEKYSFFMNENKIVAIEKSKVIVETKIPVKGNVNESLQKMKHLMNYKPTDYVDTKKSVKF